MTNRQQLGGQAVGLVVMLDAAGRTIADLEEQVEHLTTAIGAEQRLRRELEQLLAQARATIDVHPPTSQTPDNLDHAAPPRHRQAST